MDDDWFGRRVPGRGVTVRIVDHGRQKVRDQRVCVVPAPGDGDSCACDAGLDPAERNALEADTPDARRGHGNPQPRFHQGAHGLPFHCVLGDPRRESCRDTQTGDPVVEPRTDLTGQEHERRVGQLGELHCLLGGQRVGRRQDGNEGFVEYGLEADLRLVGGRFT